MFHKKLKKMQFPTNFQLPSLDNLSATLAKFNLPTQVPDNLTQIALAVCAVPTILWVSLYTGKKVINFM